MSPSTPSPMRFISKDSRQTKAKPLSALKDEVQQPVEDLKKSSNIRGDAVDQFSVHRFQSGPQRKRRNQRPLKEELDADLTAIRGLTRLNRHPKPKDDCPSSVERHEANHVRDHAIGLQPTDVPSSTAIGENDDEEAMLLNHIALQQSEKWTTNLTLSPKRRRLEHDHSTKRPAFRTLNSETSRRRFTYATSTSSPASPSLPARPSFIRPLTAQPETYTPLPEAFSPHRRGPKYVAGGMAATLEQWIIETTQTTLQGRRAQMRGFEESFLMELAIGDVLSSPGSKLTMVTGTIEDGRPVNALLLGDDVVIGSGPTRQGLRRSQLIGLREPCWSVQASEKQWVVCMDWKVLGP